MKKLPKFTHDKPQPRMVALVIRQIDQSRSDTHRARVWQIQNDFWARYSTPRLALVGGKVKAANDRAVSKANR